MDYIALSFIMMMISVEYLSMYNVTMFNEIHCVYCLLFTVYVFTSNVYVHFITQCMLRRQLNCPANGSDEFYTNETEYDWFSVSEICAQFRRSLFIWKRPAAYLVPNNLQPIIRRMDWYRSIGIEWKQNATWNCNWN